MQIKFLSLLRDNPTNMPKGSYNYELTLNDAMTIPEIEYLEQKYNNGKKFPRALRELLFLSGKGSYVNDVLYSGDDDVPNPQEEMNDTIREDLLSFNGGTMPITSPFYVIDFGAGSGTFEFVYLEDGDDPAVYASVIDYTVQTRDWDGIGNTKMFSTISAMVEQRVYALLKANNIPVLKNSSGRKQTHNTAVLSKYIRSGK